MLDLLEVRESRFFSELPEEKHLEISSWFSEDEIREFIINNIHDLTKEEVNLMLGNEEDDKSFIDIHDVLVRTTNARCYDRAHILDKIMAKVNVIDINNGKKKSAEVTAYYCQSCNRYYVLEHDYKSLSNLGIICCQIVDMKDLAGNDYSYLANKSLPMLYGYNVAEKGPSVKQRRMVLDMIIENNIWSKNRCIEFLKWLINKNANKRNMDKAIEKKEQ